MTPETNKPSRTPPSPTEEALRNVGNFVKKALIQQMRSLTQQQLAALHWRAQCEVIDVNVLINAELQKAQNSGNTTSEGEPAP